MLGYHCSDVPIQCIDMNKSCQLGLHLSLDESKFSERRGKYLYVFSINDSDVDSALVVDEDCNYWVDPEEAIHIFDAVRCSDIKSQDDIVHLYRQSNASLPVEKSRVLREELIGKYGVKVIRYTDEIDCVCDDCVIVLDESVINSFDLIMERDGAMPKKISSEWIGQFDPDGAYEYKVEGPIFATCGIDPSEDGYYFWEVWNLDFDDGVSGEESTPEEAKSRANEEFDRIVKEAKKWGNMKKKALFQAYDYEWSNGESASIFGDDIDEHGWEFEAYDAAGDAYGYSDGLSLPEAIEKVEIMSRDFGPARRIGNMKKKATSKADLYEAIDYWMDSEYGNLDSETIGIIEDFIDYLFDRDILANVKAAMKDYISDDGLIATIYDSFGEWVVEIIDEDGEVIDMQPNLSSEQEAIDQLMDYGNFREAKTKKVAFDELSEGEYIEIHSDYNTLEGEIYFDHGLCMELRDPISYDLLWGGGIDSIEEGIEIARSIAYPNKIDYWSSNWRDM